MATTGQSESKKTKSSSGGAKKTAAKSSSASRGKSTAKKTSAGASRSQANDAVALLKRDHRAVEKLFGQIEKAEGDQKVEIFQRIAMELKVHTQIEEEIFYPVSREFLSDDDEEIVNEAIVEHQSAKDLIAQIEGMDPSDQFYDAKVSVLKEMIEHHVEEEEKEYFPQVQKTDMDLKAVGQQMKARKDELMGEMGALPTQ